MDAVKAEAHVRRDSCSSAPDAPAWIITIDGPAGAGKSTVARRLADHFGYAFLDTGAMYRTITLACLEGNIPWDDDAAIARVAEQAEIRFDGSTVRLDGRDVTRAIRTPEVTAHIRYVADNTRVRSLLSRLQRRVAAGQRIVTEGRDQGTEVFPDAHCKIFLTATGETRARRRQEELRQRGQSVSYEEVLAAQEQRDREDAARPVGALRPADDAIVVYTDGMDQDEVVQRLAEIAAEKARGGR